MQQIGGGSDAEHGTGVCASSHGDVPRGSSRSSDGGSRAGPAWAPLLWRVHALMRYHCSSMAAP